MYCPCLVLPYQGSPSLWKTFVEVLTHTFPPPPPGACGIVEGSTGCCFALVLAGAVVVEPAGAAGAVCDIPAAVSVKHPASKRAVKSNFECWVFILPPSKLCALLGPGTANPRRIDHRRAPPERFASLTGCRVPIAQLEEYVSLLPMISPSEAFRTKNGCPLF